MFSKIPEKQMHASRWLLAVGWGILIISLFYDPISAHLTDPNSTFSPFRIRTGQGCLLFQGMCLSTSAYPMGARIFWGMIIPIAIVTLVAFGHEAWRRMCPLAFVSQIPRSLGWQRKRKVVNPETKSFRYELALIDQHSWLGRNQLYVQSGLLFLGLTVRLLFVNSDRLALGIFLGLTLLCALTVGFLFGGKTWCQYFCPMAPVQMVYTGPRGLLGSEAHQEQRKSISQSMCRTVDATGEEKSACVSCQSPCIDIDAERAYWENLNRPDRQMLYYSYLGLVIGFYLYFFLYSGNWNFLGGAVWTETNQLSTLLKPGFYVLGQAIPIPKLVAVPLTLAFFSAGTYVLGRLLEKAYKRYLDKHNRTFKTKIIRHRLFTIYTFLAFNILFFLGVFPTLIWLEPLRPFLAWGVVIISAIWLYRSLGRSADQYLRESLTNSLRRQLGKLTINFRQLLGDRTLEDLKSDEVYVLAKVLPGFSREQRQQTYREVLREALENGNVDSSSSLGVLQQMREQLEISSDEHQIILTELGINEPELLDPQHQLTREQRLRLESYRQALELLLLELIEEGMPLEDALQQKNIQIRSLKQEYRISGAEDAQILAELFNQNGVLMRAADAMLDQLQILAQRAFILTEGVPNPESAVFELLHTSVETHQVLVSTQLLSILEILGDQPDALRIAQTLSSLAGRQVKTVFQNPTLRWSERLSPRILVALSADVPSPQPISEDVATLLEQNATEDPLSNRPSSTTLKSFSPSQMKIAIQTLQEFFLESDPLIQAASLYAIYQLDPQQGQRLAQSLIQENKPVDSIVQETGQLLLKSAFAQRPVATPEPSAAQGPALSTPTVFIEIILSGKTEHRTFWQSEVSVGRDYSNNIVLGDKRVSRNHAVLRCDALGVSIQDLGSSNGLRIGTQVIRDRQETLTPGAQIWFTPGLDTGLTVNWELSLPTLASPVVKLGTLEKALKLFEVKFFKKLKTAQLILLAQEAEVQTYHSGDVLYHQGALADELMIVTEGTADVFVQAGDTQQWIGKIEQGQTIGELGVLTQSTRATTVIVATETLQGLVIKAIHFEALLNQDAPMVRQLLLMVSGRLQDTLSQFSDSKLLQS
jgi:pSer/pThr/pTyr-binding forkhead associated (FHA) protein